MRTIEAVAIRIKGVTVSLPRPNRHWNVIQEIHRQHPGLSIRKDWQGFLDNEGKFVGRQEACRIAAAAGQLREKKTGPAWVLFSEDLW